MYLEIILIIDGLIHYCFSKLLELFIHIKISRICFILSLILNLIYMIFYLFYPYKLNYIKYFFGIFLILILMLKKSFKVKVKSIILYYLFNLILGGTGSILYLLNRMNSWILLLTLFIISLILSFYTFIKRYPQSDKLIYEVKINSKDIHLNLNAYLDTGNFLVSDEGLPIIILDNKYFMGSFVKKIDTLRVSKNECINLYKINDFYIKIDKKFIKKEVLVGFSKMHYECMFGLCLLEG